jgi:hypothetical protein
MSDLAPWESGDRKQPFHPDAPTEKVARRGAGGRLQEIYKRQTEAFIAPPGNVVPRPPLKPRPLEPRAKFALYALAGAIAVGLGWAGVAFLIFGDEAGALRYIYASLGIVLAAIAVAVILSELPRIQNYRFGDFIPGVLVYGSRAQIEKVVGPAGVGFLTGQRIHSAGGGFLSKVFDRSSHKTAPPEIVALHVNRGGNPELVAIEWNAVHEFQRGDIVWYQPKGQFHYLMFHKLIPYVPWVSQDDATRKEVFAALRVGEIKYIDRVDAKNMGTTKVFHTDVDGNIVTGAAPQKPQRSADTEALGLSAQGGVLGGDQQYDQTADDFAVDPDQHSGNTHKYRIGGAGPLGGTGQPEQGETYEQ